MITHFWGDPNEIQWESECTDLLKQNESAELLYTIKVDALIPSLCGLALAISVLCYK